MGKGGKAGGWTIARAYADVGRRQVHYRTLTPGSPDTQPVLLLHQVSSSSRMFDRVIPEFANAGLSPVAPDLPGFGQSDALPRTTIAAWAKAMIRFGEVVKVRWPALSTHSSTGSRCSRATGLP